MRSFFDRLYQGSREDFFALAEHNLVAGNRMFVVTANPEIFTMGQQREDIRRLLTDEGTTLIADGISIVKGARMLDIDVAERIPGVELAEYLLGAGSTHGKTVFLFGAQQQVLDALQNVIKEKYPNLSVAGACNGYVDDKDSVFQQIRDAQPDIILVALGVPAQEELIYRHLQEFTKGIFVGVGGSFDVLSNTKSRAPKLFVRLNLEWLYRLIREPSRLKRFYRHNVKFIFRLKKLK